MRRVAIVTVVQYAGAASGAFFSCAESALSEGARLVVIDQASVGETVERVRSAFPKCTIVRNPRNTGFAAGANQASRLLLSAAPTLYDVIVFLDARAVVPFETLRTLCSRVARTPTLGLVGPKWLSLYDEQAEDEALHEQVASDRVFSLGLECRPGLPMVHEGYGQTDDGADDARDVAALHTGLVCARVDAMRQACIDNETYIDPWWGTVDALVDVGWRMRKAGFSVQCHADTEAHWPCGVFAQRRRRSVFAQLHERTERLERVLSVRNAVCLFLVHHSLWRLLLVAPVMAWNMWIWSLYLLLFDRASLTALWSWPRHLGWILRRRRVRNAGTHC